MGGCGKRRRVPMEAFEEVLIVKCKWVPRSDTPEWRAIHWTSRALYIEMLRRADEHGYVELGDVGAPFDVIESDGAPLVVIGGVVEPNGARLRIVDFQGIHYDAERTERQ